MHYVAGFLFNKRLSQVALIKKSKPEWQKGKLNAIGGKIETGETATQAMTREFNEETGCYVVGWELFATLVCESERHKGAPDSGQPYQVHFFRAFADADLWSVVRTQTEEEVHVVRWEDIVWLNALPNLSWLIPMALNMDKDSAERFHITEIY